jgi:hypothetical protein
MRRIVPRISYSAHLPLIHHHQRAMQYPSQMTF